jgi:serpin B
MSIDVPASGCLELAREARPDSRPDRGKICRTARGAGILPSRRFGIWFALAEQLEQRLRRELARVMAVVALMLSVPGQVRADGEPAQTAGPGVADGINAIAGDLVRAEGPGNAVVSPSSIWEALAMLHQGARGKTAAAIAGVLGLPDDRAAIGVAAAAFRAGLAEARSTAITLDTANRLWVQRRKALQPDFTTALEQWFGAGAGVVDFEMDHEAARKEINGWVSERTSGKIPELLAESLIKPNTRLVLTNAVHFKALWAKPFEKSETRLGPFSLEPDRPIDVPFMHVSGPLVAGRIGKGETAATFCEIPYEGDRLVMVIVVPEAPDGLDKVLDSLDGDWRTRLDPGDTEARAVRLSLPKWTARRSIKLREALEDFGMKRAFAGGADFSGIDGTGRLLVDAVVHEGFVEVSEEGTKAAAATAVLMKRKSFQRREEALVIKADRPFAWAIVDNITGVVLFAGTVTNPRG